MKFEDTEGVSKDSENRPLSGQRVVVTRARGQAGKLTTELERCGASVLEVPTIKIVPPTDAHDLADALLELNSYDWIIFTSTNGVDAFFEFFFKAFEDLRDIGGVRIAAVGPSTAAQLKELHLKVDVMPKEFTAARIVDALTAYESIENLKMLLVRAETATPELPKKLEEMGAIVDDVACYRTVPETEDPNGAAASLTETGADWVTFTSGSTVENFHARFDLPQLIARHPKLKLASIGPETSKAIAILGLKPTFEAKEHTIESLIRGIEKAVEKLNLKS
jgi:uroporphyrinogen III methyltransferase / synthase